MLKNLGVVKWFGSGDKNYGFITVLSGNDNPADKKDIFFHREGINPASVIYKGERLSVYPHEGDFVSFDIVDTAKGLKAVNVTVLNAQALANETNFADEAGYKDFRRKIMSASSGKKFFDKFIAAVPEENFRKYPWLREELSRQKHVELCLEIYVETPTPELESEMTEILSCIGNEIKFQIPPELAVKKFFREHSDIESKRAALEKYFDTLTVEEIAHLTKKDFSPEEIIDAIKDKSTFGEKFPALIKIFLPRTSRLDDWAKIIFAHNLPQEIILPRLNELNHENKLVAVEKYFDTLTVEEIADFTKDFSPEKIIDVIKGKSTFGEKFPALAKIFIARTSRLDDWAKFIFAHNLPQEIILPRINELNHENKLVAVEKYFDTLTVEEIADFTKDFSPEEIIDAIKDKSTFGEKLPVIIENSSANKFFWACYLVDNVELFRQIKIGEDVLIFFMYESVNRWNGKLQDLNTLIKLLQEKIDDIEAAPRAKIVYCYICAAFAKHFAKRLEDRGETESRNEYLSTCDKFINDADDTFTEIFNLLVGKIKTIAENPDEATIEETFKDFFKSEAQLLPSCRKFHDDENCIFCEAVTWNKKVVGNDGKESFDLQSWCPRGRIAEFCSRLFPKIELPAKDWSVIELMAKLNLVPRENLPENHKYNLEFFTRLGGEFNRIKDLLERIKCRKCGKSMRAVKGLATWKEITNLRKTAYGDHFAIFAATTFSCQNKNCSEKDELVYLSYCWHCGEIIDSRDNHVRIKGFYLCNKCGAGYRDFVGTDHYTIFPGEICPSCTKCPKCGCQDFAIIGIDDGKGQLQCTKCKRVMNAPLKITSTSKDGIHVKGKCSCGHRLEWNTKHLWSNLTPIPW